MDIKLSITNYNGRKIALEKRSRNMSTSPNAKHWKETCQRLVFHYLSIHTNNDV